MNLSVRFFKRLILTLLALMIAVPLFFSIWFGVANSREKAQSAALRQQLTETQQQLLVELNRLASASHMDSGELAYQHLYPNLYCETPRDKAWVKAERTAYLTFDDGPSANTLSLLNTLDDNDAKATFFVTGQGDTTENKALIKEISTRGHTVGIHSYSHEYRSVYASVEDYLADFDAVYQMVYEATGVKPEIFRFPGGSVNSYNQSIYQELVAEMLRRGFVFYDWNVSGEDTVYGATAERVSAAVLDGMERQKRGIVLLHDAANKHYTVEALPRIISGLKEQGYSFEPLTSVVLPIMFSYKARA